MHSHKYGRRQRESKYIYIVEKVLLRSQMHGVVCGYSRIRAGDGARSSENGARYKETSERRRSIPRSGALGCLTRARGSAFFRDLFSFFPACPFLSMASPLKFKGRSFYSTRSGRYKHSRPLLIIPLVTLPIHAVPLIP